MVKKIMLTFTITTSTKLASMSLFKDDLLLGNITINVKRTHSINILSQVKSLFDWSDEKISNVTHVIISKGPGSFTGIRIAMALIKGIFALDKDVEIYSVSELDAIYYNVKNLGDIIVSGIDSRKGKIYYNIHTDQVKTTNDSIGNIYELIKNFENSGKSLVFAGDIAYNYRDEINKLNHCKLSYHKLLVDSKIFYDMFKEGLATKEDISTLAPYYLEKSQAEKEYKGE